MIYLSLGAGVQSTALLILSAKGLHGCPKADVAIFADTQDEPRWVYDYIETLRAWSPIPIEVVTAGKLSEAGEKFLRIPAFTACSDGSASLLRRQCTNEYKLVPLQRRVREHLGLRPRQRAGDKKAVALIGISLDEAHRMKPSRVPYILNTYPLVDAGIKRDKCLEIIAAEGLPMPRKSACVFCPYHDNNYWRDLRDNHPEEFSVAVAYDKRIRDSTRAGVRLPAFLHRNLVPLDEVDLSDPYKDQLNFNFGNECEGMCGV